MKDKKRRRKKKEWEVDVFSSIYNWGNIR